VANIVAANVAPAVAQVAAPVSAAAPASTAINSPSVAATSAPVLQAVPTIPEPPVFEGSYGNEPNDDYVPASEDEYEPAPAYYEAPVAAPEVSEPKKSEAAQPPVVTAAASVPVAIAPAEPVKVPTSKTLRKVPYEQASPADWTEIYLGLGVTGILQSTVANCQMTKRQGNDFYFVLDQANSTLYDTSHEKRLADLLSDYGLMRDDPSCTQVFFCRSDT
jgi:DNA polymerase-3 subunit gamma/tau